MVLQQHEHLREVLGRWQQRVGDIATLQSLNEAQTVFAVTTTDGQQYVLKNLAGGPGADRIETMLQVLRHLDAAGVPVAVPIITDDGHSILSSGNTIYVLLQALTSSWSTDPDETERAYTHLGAAIAKLHKALATFPNEVRSWRMDLPHRILDEAVPAILSHQDVSSAAELMHAVTMIAEPLRAALSGLPEQYIHGDCHGGNVLIDHGQVMGFIDVDHLPIGPRVYDVGYLLADFAKAQFMGSDIHMHWMALFDRVVAGYEQESPLSHAEKGAIVYIMLATQLLFVEWFFKASEMDLAHKNLAAFYWIFERRDEITQRTIQPVALVIKRSPTVDYGSVC